MLFTSIHLTALLEITLSMDGKGAWRDDFSAQRLWQSIK